MKRLARHAAAALALGLALNGLGAACCPFESASNQERDACCSEATGLALTASSASCCMSQTGPLAVARLEEHGLLHKGPAAAAAAVDSPGAGPRPHARSAVTAPAVLPSALRTTVLRI